MDLQVSQLDLSAGQRQLVRALDLCVGPGELWCVLGKNGAGKSTLLRTLAGLRRAEGASIRLSGKPLASWSIAQLARLRAYLAQQQSDTFSSSVRDTVLSARHPYHSTLAARLGLDSARDRRAADAALERFALTGLLHHDVLSLSGGERRLVALATVFAQETELMLLDEPAAHLDVDVAQRVFSILADAVRSGRSILASVHDPNLAARFATHVLQLLPDGSWLAQPAGALDAASLSTTFSHPIELVQTRQGARFLAS